MSNSLPCPGCGMPIELTVKQCPYCSQIFQPQTPSEERWLPAWTQGIADMASGGYFTGSYDAIDYPALPLSQALHALKNLPIPPRASDPGDYCPLALGFGERNISRNDDGSYFLWPEDRSCAFDEARRILLQIYEGALKDSKANKRRN